MPALELAAPDVGRFEAVALDALVDEAAMLRRVDRKYVVDSGDAATFIELLAPETRVLEIAGSRASAYESMYFDTPDLLSWRMAALGRRRRFKVRTRAYLDSETAFLEVKTRGARSMTLKEREAYDFARRHELMPDGIEYAREAIAAVGIHPARADELRPALTTRYRRTTLLPSAPGVRVTIDTDLAWEIPGGATLRLRDVAIIETKSTYSASTVDRTLWRTGHRPVSVSKYGTGLAALRPDLPSSKWVRVLRRWFAPERKELTCAR